MEDESLLNTPIDPHEEVRIKSGNPKPVGRFDKTSKLAYEWEVRILRTQSNFTEFGLGLNNPAPLNKDHASSSSSSSSCSSRHQHGNNSCGAGGSMDDSIVNLCHFNKKNFLKYTLKATFSKKTKKVRVLVWCDNDHDNINIKKNSRTRVFSAQDLNNIEQLYILIHLIGPYSLEVLYDRDTNGLTLRRNPLKVLLSKANTIANNTAERNTGGAIAMHRNDFRPSCIVPPGKGMKFRGMSPYDSWKQNQDDKLQRVSKFLYTWEIDGRQLVELVHTQRTQEIRLHVNGTKLLDSCFLSPSIWRGIQFSIGPQAYKILMRYDVEDSKNCAPPTKMSAMTEQINKKQVITSASDAVSKNSLLKSEASSGDQLVLSPLPVRSGSTMLTRGTIIGPPRESVSVIGEDDDNFANAGNCRRRTKECFRRLLFN